MLLTHHARTLHAPYTHHALAARTLLTPSPLPHVQVGWLLLSLTDRPHSYYLTFSLSYYLTILLSNYLTKVGWLLLSLTDPMGPPGPVLEAVLSAGGEVSGQ